MINQRLNYIDFTNVVEVVLYVLSLLMCLNFYPYYVEPTILLTEGDEDKCTGFDQTYFNDLQHQTELRQVI